MIMESMCHADDCTGCTQVLHVDFFTTILFSMAYESARLPLPYMHGHDDRALESCLQCATIQECMYTEAN